MYTLTINNGKCKCNSNQFDKYSRTLCKNRCRYMCVALTNNRVTVNVVEHFQYVIACIQMQLRLQLPLFTNEPFWNITFNACTCICLNCDKWCMCCNSGSMNMTCLICGSKCGPCYEGQLACLHISIQIKHLTQVNK